jgi:hypothetical protein
MSKLDVLFFAKRMYPTKEGEKPQVFRDTTNIVVPFDNQVEERRKNAIYHLFIQHMENILSYTPDDWELIDGPCPYQILTRGMFEIKLHRETRERFLFADVHSEEIEMYSEATFIKSP